MIGAGFPVLLLLTGHYKLENLKKLQNNSKNFKILRYFLLNQEPIRLPQVRLEIEKGDASNGRKYYRNLCWF
jgi:hypothetical protein